RLAARGSARGSRLSALGSARGFRLTALDFRHRVARAYWILAPGRGEIREEPVGTPGAGDIGVRAQFSGISRGTEALVFQGRVPASEYHRMRAPFQTGEFPGPLKSGYSSVGIV